MVKFMSEAFENNFSNVEIEAHAWEVDFVSFTKYAVYLIIFT